MTDDIIVRLIRETRIVLMLLLSALLCGAFFLSIQEVQARSLTQYPSDFTMTAFSGGSAPWERLEKIELNSTGYATYWLMTNRTTAEWVLDATFILSTDNMTAIWNAIQDNNFFSLASSHVDPVWNGGSYCNITITANEQTHSVYTQNIKVPEFDTIAITINNVTPGDLDLFYNEIHPDIHSPTIATAIATTKEVTATYHHFSAFLYATLAFGAMFFYFQGAKKEVQGPSFRALLFSIRSLMLFFVLIMVIVDIVAADYTEVTWTQCNIKIDVYLEFYGPGVTEVLVNGWEAGIERVWNCEGSFRYDDCTVTFDVHTKIRKATDPETPDYHQIHVIRGPSRSRATKTRFDPTTGKASKGRGTWDDQDTPEVAAHETGHLMGRPDKYKDEDGSVPIDPKYNDDIMAMTWDSPKPHREHIEGIIRESGRTAPPKPRALPPEDGKNQSMSFVAPFDLADLMIPGSVTFELDLSNMVSHSLTLELPDHLGGGIVNPDFQYGYGEIFFNYTQDPDTIVFYLRSWVMVYSGFEIQGEYTEMNMGISDPWSHGFWDVPTGDLIIYEVGFYVNDIYPSTNPVWWDITYSGHLNFTTNVIHLIGSGTVYFPRLPTGDIEITYTSISKSVTSNTITYIAATILNIGNETATYDVFTFYNKSLIGTKTATELNPGISSIVTFRWNTTAVPLGIHNISFIVLPHYVYIAGTVSEVPRGEIIPDGEINILDIATAAKAFGSDTPREDINRDGIVDDIDAAIVYWAFGSLPEAPGWNPDADLNEDGEINVFDLNLIAANFGQMSHPRWNQLTDINADAEVNILDIALVAIQYGYTYPWYSTLV